MDWFGMRSVGKALFWMFWIIVAVLPLAIWKGVELLAWAWRHCHIYVVFGVK